MQYKQCNKPQRGAALIEFALVLPILLALLIGLIYYGYVFMLDAAVTHAAKQGAQVAVNIDPVEFETSTAYQNAVIAQITNSVTNSMSWLPQSVRTGLVMPLVLDFGDPPAGQQGTLLIITVTMTVTGGTSPLLRQINLPRIGKVPPLPSTLNGVAQVVL